MAIDAGGGAVRGEYVRSVTFAHKVTHGVIVTGNETSSGTLVVILLGLHAATYVLNQLRLLLSRDNPMRLLSIASVIIFHLSDLRPLRRKR